MAISKKNRFEVFKADNFTCVYCGRTPPDVTLEVDHIIPKSKGGEDIQENLLTACFDCNRGKRDNLLTSPDKPDYRKDLEILKEREEQLDALDKTFIRFDININYPESSLRKIFKYFCGICHNKIKEKNGGLSNG
jgi:hypothetical protein